MKIEKIKLNKDNRMLRIGFGKNKGLWFFRVDLWFVGYRFKKNNIYHRENNLPKILFTKSDFESVLNYYILHHWDMSHEYIDGLYNLTINLKQPLSVERINLMKNYIEEHKNIGIKINYN